MEQSRRQVREWETKNASERGLDDAVADSGSEIDKDALWSEVGPRKAVGAHFEWVSKGQGKIVKRRREGSSA